MASRRYLLSPLPAVLGGVALFLSLLLAVMLCVLAGLAREQIYVTSITAAVLQFAMLPLLAQLVAVDARVVRRQARPPSDLGVGLHLQRVPASHRSWLLVIIFIFCLLLTIVTAAGACVAVVTLAEQADKDQVSHHTIFLIVVAVTFGICLVVQLVFMVVHFDAARVSLLSQSSSFSASTSTSCFHSPVPLQYIDRTTPPSHAFPDLPAPTPPARPSPALLLDTNTLFPLKNAVNHTRLVTVPDIWPSGASSIQPTRRVWSHSEPQPYQTASVPSSSSSSARSAPSGSAAAPRPPSSGSILSSFTNANRTTDTMLRLLEPYAYGGSQPLKIEPLPAVTGRRDSGPDGFDSWDASDTEQEVEEGMLPPILPPPPAPPVPNPRTHPSRYRAAQRLQSMETIAASPAQSRSSSPIDSEAVQRSRSYDTLRPLTPLLPPPAVPLPPPPAELTPHPVYRMTPRPVATPGTAITAGAVITAAPRGGEIPLNREHVRSLSRLRSGSMQSAASRASSDNSSAPSPIPLLSRSPHSRVAKGQSRGRRLPPRPARPPTGAAHQVVPPLAFTCATANRSSEHVRRPLLLGAPSVHTSGPLASFDFPISSSSFESLVGNFFRYSFLSHTYPI